jgi:hypothetical protein
MGISMGLGSFIFTPWPVVTLVFLISLFWAWIIHPGKNLPYFILALGGMAITLIPFTLAVFREGYGTHILSLSPWGGWYHSSKLLPNLLDYLTMLFWGVSDPEPAYTPVNGGFLNPFLGSFFLLGVVELSRFRGESVGQMGGRRFFHFPASRSLITEC